MNSELCNMISGNRWSGLVNTILKYLISRSRCSQQHSRNLHPGRDGPPWAWRWSMKSEEVAFRGKKPLPGKIMDVGGRHK